MAISDLKGIIDATITTNGRHEITGASLNEVLTQMVDATDAELAELSDEVDGIKNEVVYPNPLWGVEFGDKKADIFLKKILKDIWIEVLDDSFQFHDKLFLYVLRNTTEKSPQFIVQVCHTAQGGDNIVFAFSSATKGAGVVEIKCAGFGLYKNKANLHMLLDFNDNEEDVNYSGTSVISTEFITKELNEYKPETMPVTSAIRNLEKNLVENTKSLSGELSDMRYILSGDMGNVCLDSTRTRIAIYVDNTPNISQYKLRILSDNPTTNTFSVYKAKSDHSGLELYIKKANIGEWTMIDRDEEKPCLYIYDTSITDEVIDAIPYLVEFQSASSLIQDVEDLKAKESNGLSWKGKTIVCFGDSITEFKDLDNNKAYADYIHDLTEAEVINIGIGGTQFRIRVPVVDAPTTTNEAYAALDIVSMVRACCEQDFAKQIAATNYLTANKIDANDAIIARMQTIDWSKVDVVTFFGGTNDWNNAPNSWGEPSKENTDINTTFGAINEIVRLLLTTYPHLVIYWFTPTVRWVASLADRTDDTWSDNFKKNNTTLKEFSADVEDLVKLHHIPICDMYNTLGWNQYNFSQYFTDSDGTHPRKGKGTEQIARKIIAFINANKTF